VKAKSLGVKQAPFYVLVGAKMPSVLIECGFISNRQEAKKLNTNFYRQKIAEGIYKGLKSYINQFNGSY
jgi:N-acetylmuramoyl-L-alanine amidase